MNERAFLTQLEAATPDELAELLRRPTADEQRVLEVYFGAARLERLRSLALRTTRRAAPRGNVVVLHGIMGGELTVYPPQKSSQYIWMSIPRLAIGGIGWLRMTPEPRSQYDVRPTGILKKWYGEQLLGLAADGWKVQAFFYDWRLDLADLADGLRRKIDEWFGPGEPVNLVAHSMGGLVSRTYILRHPQRWAKGGRLIMLGTPNHGSFAIPQVITGAMDTVRKLALVDITHRRAELLTILNSFPGALQMLPSPHILPAMAPMYDAATWAGYGVTSRLLELARRSHDRLVPVVDGARMTYIAGCNQPTKVGVANWKRLDDPRGYQDGLDGDGTVPHSLSFLKDGGKRIPTYFVECEHGGLPNHAGAIAATQQLLAGGAPSLPTQPPATRGLSRAAQAEMRSAREQAEELELQELATRIRVRTRGAQDEAAPISRDEVAASELLLRSFLAVDSSTRMPAPQLASGSAAPTPARAPQHGKAPVAIRIRLLHRGLQEIAPGTPPVDAISVGHYAGIAPQNAELALDRAISGAGGDLLITALHQRGVIPAALGQSFQLTDPRDPRRGIVLAGMGEPGNFREAELAVLARELVWLLGRSGRQHLQTVTIGCGAGNLQPADAIRSWMRGIRRALFDARAAAAGSLGTITFVEHSAANLLRLHQALLEAQSAFAADPEPLLIQYTKPDPATLKALHGQAESEARKRGAADFRKSLALPSATAEVTPIRLSVQVQRETYAFAALTADASIPQRETQIDPALVDQANDRLPEAALPAEQLDRGHLLGRLVLPEDLREHVVRPGIPLVLAVDATTARVHWEMVALNPAEEAAAFPAEQFLGTACGLTRQLRTNFAPLPEPPLLGERPLRVLVVADPAEDAALPGAQEEGAAVAAIFEEFGRAHAVEVVRLFGPGEATRVAVLDQLINHRFDILHYAGHCFFDPKNPAASGWIFRGSPREVLAARELSRVDRIPRFVFSNACESGITPDRAATRSAGLAPSFAEAFFAQGVANFIATAWPVGDAAALAFARRVYRGLLGLCAEGAAPERAFEALTAARIEVAQTADGVQTWGAYQHYGDPNFRIVAPANAAGPPPPPRKASGRKPKSAG